MLLLIIYLSAIETLICHREMSLTLSQTSPGFYVSAILVFWKHYVKSRNFSELAISPFPAVFSTHLDELSAIFIKSEIVVNKFFVWKSLKFVVWERVSSVYFLRFCIKYMIIKILYWTHSGIVFNKCCKKTTIYFSERVDLTHPRCGHINTDWI